MLNRLLLEVLFEAALKFSGLVSRTVRDGGGVRCCRRQWVLSVSAVRLNGSTELSDLVWSHLAEEPLDLGCMRVVVG